MTAPLPDCTCHRIAPGHYDWCRRVKAAKAAKPQPQHVVWLNAVEVARFLRVSKMTVYRLARSGDIRAVRVGRLLRIGAASVDAYLAGALVADE